MPVDLLTVKLYVPPLRPNLVPRPRLTAAVSQALAHSLTLVSAPAGYGKTTLVSGWLREADIASAWLSLDESDNDPSRFLQYFMTALRTIIPTIQWDRPGMLQAMQAASFDALMSGLINEITAHTAPVVLVLDDFHVIHAQPVLEMLTFLLEHMPPALHLVLLSRTDPPLPLSRLRARNQLIDIRADQLRFTSKEVAAFLGEMGLNLPVGDVAALEARTEGWIAGLQLAGLSLQGCQDTHRFISAFTGSHTYIIDYLTDEVLNLQPEQVRSFLLQTSILNRMCGPLCDAVVEADRGGSLQGEAMLETLAREEPVRCPPGRRTALVPLPPPFRRHAQPASGAPVPPASRRAASPRFGVARAEWLSFSMPSAMPCGQAIGIALLNCSCRTAACS